MIEQIQIADFTLSSTTQVFSINLQNEGAFKLIRGMTFYVANAGVTLSWGFSATSSAVTTVVGVNAPGVSPSFPGLVTSKVVTNDSMVGTTNAYLCFSITGTVGNTVQVVVTYYDFNGFANPTHSLLSGNVAISGSASLVYGTTPKLEVIKSLWLSAPEGQTINYEIAIVAGINSRVAEGTIVSSSSNVLPASLGIWLPNNTYSISVINMGTSTAAVNYYLTGIGR